VTEWTDRQTYADMLVAILCTHIGSKVNMVMVTLIGCHKWVS